MLLVCLNHSSSVGQHLGCLLVCQQRCWRGGYLQQQCDEDVTAGQTWMVLEYCDRGCLQVRVLL
jgi:hypothetical protein